MNPVDKFFDRIVQRVLDIVMPKVVEMIAHSGAQARDGFILRNTYNPADGTATVVFSDTVAVFTDQGDTPVMIPGIPIVTGGIGNQIGPVGDERVKIHATQSGYVATLVHDVSPNAPDTQQSPGAAPGAQIIGAHSNPIYIGARTLSPSNDASVRIQNLQQGLNDLRSQVQAAFNNGFSRVSGGSGITPPNVGSVTATGSNTVLVKD